MEKEKMEEIEQWKREAEERMKIREKYNFQREYMNRLIKKSIKNTDTATEELEEKIRFQQAYINRLEERQELQDNIISSLERVIKLVIQRNGTKENNNAV